MLTALYNTLSKTSWPWERIVTEGIRQCENGPVGFLQIRSGSIAGRRATTWRFLRNSSTSHHVHCLYNETKPDYMRFGCLNQMFHTDCTSLRMLRKGLKQGIVIRVS